VLQQTDEAGGFFGYYDKSPESPDGKHLAWHRIVRSEGKRFESEICVKNFGTGQIVVADKTEAVNLQMGARLQWVDNERLVYNFYNPETDSYRAKLKNILTGNEHTLDAPVFDVSGNRFLSLDFKQLAACGSEYGYFAHRNFSGTDPVIWEGDMLTGDHRTILTLSDILKVVSGIPEDAADIHFNHLMYAPSGKAFIFFFRFTTGSGRREYLLLHNIALSETIVLNSEMTSHCCWMNDYTIAGYLSHQGKAGFFRIDTVTLQYQPMFVDSQHGDGHPSWKNGIMLFDSYPDHARMQHLYISGNNQVLLAGSFYSPMIFDEFYRCDLHPRFSPDGKKIYFDSLHQGRRHLYSLELNSHE
jgi:hypothetical protein